MESKYYTPAIEEFHVGFEYEVNFGDKWISEVQLNGFLHNKKLENIRVKYLDKEGIESLGFKLDPEASSEREDRWNFELFLDSNDRGIINYGITLFDTTDLIIYTWNGSKEHIVFTGEIKNKSELKRLMKQLRIIK